MMRVKTCEYNMDTGCIDVIYDDGKMLSIYIPAIEESLRTTIYSRSRLDLLLDSEPLYYAEMALDGTLQEYVDRIDGIAEGQMKNYTEQIAERFPKNIAEDIAREMLMYNS